MLPKSLNIYNNSFTKNILMFQVKITLYAVQEFPWAIPELLRFT